MRSARCARGVIALAAVVLGGPCLGVLAGCTSGTAPGEGIQRESGGVVGSRFHEGIPYAGDRVLDIHVPSRQGWPNPATVPVVILLHGCCGDRSDLGKLSEALARAQLVVFNADWAGLDADATFPAAYEDVACAIDFARQHAPEFGGDPERLVVAGWSDGAMAAAAVAAAPERFDGQGCLAEKATDAVAPAAVAGIGGFYGWTAPVAGAYVTPRTSRFFGGGPEEAAENWAAATPYSWLASAPSTLLLAGTTDPLVDDARRYAEALRRAGRSVRVVAIPPDGDQTLISPRTSEGRRVVAEIAALGAATTQLTSPHRR
ncbi:MAG TPA: alpha/beta hydrolase [Ornithinibacter sp.]|nr:alpha/beta hydrolase [Ornithinibacter sp.]